MNALANILPAIFRSSSNYKRAVDPTSNPDRGFTNGSSQKTVFPGGAATKTTSTKESSSTTPVATPSSSSSSSSSATTVAPTSLPSTTLPPSSSIDNPMSISSSSSSTVSPSSSSLDSNNASDNLSGSAIGAIVAVVLIICCGCLAFFIMRRRRQKRMLARAGAGAMRDPYNEGFVSFPPPPPMAFTSHQDTPPAAGPAQYQHQLQPMITPPPMIHDYQSTFPITEPSMAETPSLSSSNVPATILTSVPPNQPGTDIWQQPPIGTFTIVATYVPTLSDEIDVQPNDQVQVFEEYDDGWCLGVNITRGQTRGVFPKHCIAQSTTVESQVKDQTTNPSSMSLVVSESTNIATAGKRVSSLYMENPHPIHS